MADREFSVQVGEYDGIDAVDPQAAAEEMLAMLRDPDAFLPVMIVHEPGTGRRWEVDLHERTVVETYGHAPQVPGDVVAALTRERFGDPHSLLRERFASPPEQRSRRADPAG